MNANPLTPEEYHRFGHALGARLSEHLDGFAIVGFHATTGQPVIFTMANDLKTRCALNDLLRIALQTSAVMQHQPPPDNGASKTDS